MLRVLGSASACLALAALLAGSAAERSTREVLRREAVTLLPAGSHVLTAEYREPC